MRSNLVEIPKNCSLYMRCPESRGKSIARSSLKVLYSAKWLSIRPTPVASAEMRPTFSVKHIRAIFTRN